MPDRCGRRRSAAGSSRSSYGAGGGSLRHPVRRLRRLARCQSWNAFPGESWLDIGFRTLAQAVLSRDGVPYGKEFQLVAGRPLARRHSPLVVAVLGTRGGAAMPLQVLPPGGEGPVRLRRLV